MFLSVKEMEIRKVRFDETVPPGKIDYSRADVRQISPLVAVGSAVMVENAEGEVHITGKFKVDLEADCDRCLGRASFPIESAFDLFYMPAPSAKPEHHHRSPREEEIELDEGESEVGFYEGSGLELNDVLLEQILLALPMQRICKEDCLGICPVCGRNRNETSCSCREKPADDRWKALRDLK